MAEVQMASYLNNGTNTYFLGDKQVILNPYSEAASSGNDPDAQAFIDVTGISGTDATAINTLVVSLKANSLWTKMKAIYPMVGGTSTTCKYNLKNPVDSNAAFRLSFGGTWTFGANGAQPNGAAGTYADTFFSPATHLTATNGHISYYSTTDSSLGGTMVEMGCDDGGNEINLAASYGNTAYAFYAGAGGGVANGSTSKGYYITNRGTNTEGWRNGVRLINTGAGTVSVPTRVIYIGAENNGSTSYRNSDRNCAFSTIGDSLSSTDAENLSTIVNTFCTTLGRNVYGIPTDGLVALYDASNTSSYPGSGTTWTDVSGQGGTGTIVGSPSFNSTTKLFTFSGGQRVDISQFLTAGDPTYSYYVIASSANGGTTQVFGQGTEANNQRAFMIRLSGYYGFNGYNNDNNTPSGMSVADNTLKSIALTMDNDAATQSQALRFYLNGAYVSTSGTTAGATNLNVGTTARIGSNAGNGELFSGTIGVCIAYNRVLTDAEIALINNYYSVRYTLV